MSSGIIQGNDWTIIDKEKEIGKIEFNSNAKNAIFFRGIPSKVGSETFSKGNYIFGASENHISLKKPDGTILKPSMRDNPANGEKGKPNPRHVGFENEKGIRGLIEKGEIKIDIIHQNNAGLKIDDTTIGSTANTIEIISNNNINVKIKGKILNSEIINNKGKTIITTQNNKKYTEEKGETLKIINSKSSQEIKADRLKASANSGRIYSGSKGIKNFRDIKRISDTGNTQRPLDTATFHAINSRRGSNLAWSDRIAEVSLQHSKTMAERGWLGKHDGFSNRLRLIGGGGGSENIAMFGTSQQLSPEEIGRRFTNQWMNSRGHRNNIMSRHSKTGVGVYMIQRGNLYYYYATQMFQ